MPAKKASGRLSSSAKHTLLPSPLLNSEKLVNGTRQRFAEPSQRSQCGESVRRTFVTPGSRFFTALFGDGRPTRTFATKEGVTEATNRLMDAIRDVGSDVRGVSERLDRVIEARPLPRGGHAD